MNELESSPKLFIGHVDHEDKEELSGDEAGWENAATTCNPNKDDDRRLLQVRAGKFSQDPSIPIDEQPNNLGSSGPTELLYPDHFYEVQGGVVVIYWETDRSTACIASIQDVEGKDETFIFKAYDRQGKMRKTFHDTGKGLVAHAKDVQRMVHRTEFEEKESLVKFLEDKYYESNFKMRSLIVRVLSRK